MTKVMVQTIDKACVFYFMGDDVDHEFPITPIGDGAAPVTSEYLSGLGEGALKTD